MGTKILAIDDDKDNLTLYSHLIRKYMPEAEVVTAAGGFEGLQILSADPPDIVLLDARMPDMNGFEVCRRIKTTPATADIPVLMISGAYVEPRHRISGFEGGADGYMCKPFKAQELVAQMKALLKGSPDRAAAFTVMVVEPSRTSRQVVLAEIKRNPIAQVAVFETADEALSALEAVDPDLVLAAADLRTMDGPAFCERFREGARFKTTPFILLVDRLDDEASARALRAGVTEIFRKPFKPFELTRQITRQINLRDDWFDNEVLVVDATPSVRRIFKQYLAGVRLKVHEAVDTVEANEILKSKPVDLIIVDHDLPGQTGLEWCRAIKRSDEHMWIPVLGITSESNLGIEFIKAGANDYLSKELVKEEIVLRVENLLKQVKLTKQLHTAIHKEQALNEHKNRLLGIAAHDIRSPIAAIAHYAEWMIDNPSDDRAILMKALMSVHNLARHALELLNRILDVSSIQSGVLELNRTVFRLDELLEERLAFINELGARKNIRGTLVTGTAAGEDPLVSGDRYRISQVIDNLLSNAVKYSPEGSTFNLHLRREVEGWLVEVQDNGPGIPKDELFGVFDEFGRTSVTATGGERSTGLGLAIAKKLVEMHEGTIWIESEVGKGTTVSFVLPRHEG